jgi:hypothetical protein
MEQPSNINFLNPKNFTFSVKKTPNLNFFVQKISLPGLQLPSPHVENPFNRYPVTGDHISFETIELQFKVDEELANYMEIYNWIIANGFPEKFDQYKTIREMPKFSGKGIYSDISVIVKDSTMTPRYEFVYRDAIPIALGSLNFETTDSQITFINCATAFIYRDFVINTV